MSPGNRPKSHSCNGLTANGGDSAIAPPGSTQKANPPGRPRASSPVLRQLFAPGTPAAAAGAGGSRGRAADVDELVAPLGRPTLAAGGGAASAEPVVGTEAFRRSGTGAAVTGSDVEPDILPPAGAGAHVGARVLAAANGVGTYTPALGDLVAG